jgi:hypothetical protein
MKLKQGIKVLTGLLLVFVLLLLLTPARLQAIGETGQQTLLAMQFVLNGVQVQGKGVLQVGQVGTLSAAVASNTTAQVVAAPSAGSIYLQALWIEKMTTATGSINVINGTGTNCGTGTATLFSLSLATSQIPPLVGYVPVNVLVPAVNALCIQTDASTTSVRVIAQ